MCAVRFQNDSHTTGRVPGYYARNRLYKDSYTRNDWPGRTSRRLHDGLTIDRNYGLDTTSDDVNSSPYSSPYYINGRYNSSNLTTQRGNSASVQGTTRLLTVHDEVEDFGEADVQTTIEMWQGKQIRFSLPYSGKVVGHTVEVQNIGGCKGILSFYFSYTPEGPVIAESAIDLCTVSEDNFEHRKLYMMTPIPQSPKGDDVIYVRMEIWDEIDCKRSTNPFNTGKKILISATGLDNHEECVQELGEKNMPVFATYSYATAPSRPCMGIIYNNWVSVPTNRTEGLDRGARISKDNYNYDIYCIKNGATAEVLIYDLNTNRLIPNNIKVDARVENLNIVQAEDKVYYVDGYSPLQRFTIGEWNTYTFPTPTTENVQVSINEAVWVASDLGGASGVYVFTYQDGSWTYLDEPVNLADYGITLTGWVPQSGQITVRYQKATETTTTDLSVEYNDTRPVVAASIIIKHNNRIYLSGFRYDGNLVQCTSINTKGPDFNSYPYRFYAPNDSPLANTTNRITAIVEYESDTLMIAFEGGYSLYTSNENLEDAIPQQVSSYSDGAGVAAAGDIVCYRGIIYSFDADEGIRRFTGALWNKIPGQEIDNLYERVDLNRPRKLWGYAYKLYFNYYDSVDGKAKCIIWDMDMNYQQFPWFQDSDIPFCDVRYDDDFDLMGIHPDFPCIMRLYTNDVWRRLDTPITFERHTKYLSLPGNSANMILKRVHNKVIANSNRWWWFGISYDSPSLIQYRGNDIWFRQPSWDTIDIEQPVESPFPNQEEYEEKAIALLTLPNLRVKAISAQVKIKCKTFRAQANLISTVLEAGVVNYL